MVSITGRKLRRRNDYSLNSSSQCGTPSPRIYNNEQNLFESSFYKAHNQDKKRKGFAFKTFLVGLSTWKYFEVLLIVIFGKIK